MRLERVLLAEHWSVLPSTTLDPTSSSDTSSSSSDQSSSDGGGGSLLSIYGVGSVLVILAVSVIFLVGCAMVSYCGWMNWKQSRQMEEMKRARRRRSSAQSSGRSRTGTIEPVNMAGQKRLSQRSILKEKRGMVVAYDSDSDSPTESGGSHNQRGMKDESSSSSGGEGGIPEPYRMSVDCTVTKEGRMEQEETGAEHLGELGESTPMITVLKHNLSGQGSPASAGGSGSSPIGGGFFTPRSQSVKL